MPVSAFEVSTSCLLLWRYVPTPAPLVGDEGQTKARGDFLGEKRVMVDRGEPVGNREGGALEGG